MYQHTKLLMIDSFGFRVCPLTKHRPIDTIFLFGTGSAARIVLPAASTKYCHYDNKVHTMIHHFLPSKNTMLVQDINADPQ